MSSLALLAAAVAGSCRDAPAAFDAKDRGDPLTGTARLTFAAGDEHTPRWTPDGDRIVYSGRGFAPFPASDGVLFSVPATGGAVEALLPTVQAGTVSPGVLTQPALSADGSRVAYLRVQRLLSSTACAPPPFAVTCDGTFTEFAPMLLQGLLRAREVSGTGDPDMDPTLSFRPEGFTTIPGDVEVRTLRDFPFHRYTRFDGIFPIGPSWDPRGERIVFSDGRRLSIWEAAAGTEEVVPIPGTEDALSPAWSPDGEWIAFTREAIQDSVLVTCEQRGPLGPFCSMLETIYQTAPPAIELVRPDGSDGRVLAAGRDPAWSADGRRVFYASADGIRSIAFDGTGDGSIPSTDGGREPAVSPDGARLAFTRRSASSGYDVWVTDIP